MYCDTTHTLPHSVICTVILLSTLCPSGIFHQHWLTSEGSWWGVKSRPLSRYHDHGEDGGKVDETGQHLCQWGWWGVGSQTINAFTNFSTANTEHNSNGGSSEGTIFWLYWWQELERLRCWACPPGRNFLEILFLVQSWDEIATLYCQS